MDSVKRTERLTAITRILTEEPNRSFPLGYFCQTFEAAKSTISEDLEIIRRAMERFSLGKVETISGAAGGVRYRPFIDHAKGYAQVQTLCEQLGEAPPPRVLQGELLYLADIIANPQVIGQMSVILASEYYAQAPDYVLTMEMQGIPLAMMTAQALNVPLRIARRESKAYEGPAVHISYPSGSGYKTMSLPRSPEMAGKRVLLIDDVLRSGGTILGMHDLAREFGTEVVGTAVLVNALKRRGDDGFEEVKSLLVLERIEGQRAILRPGDWLKP